MNYPKIYQSITDIYNWKGMRLFNLRDEKKHPNEATCTVCGTKKNIGSTKK